MADEALLRSSSSRRVKTPPRTTRRRATNKRCLLLLSWLVLFGAIVVVRSTQTASAQVIKKKKVYKYNICNGLSNQLLYHAAAIATAIVDEQQKNDDDDDVVIQIPDYFIVNGAQTSSQQQQQQVLPTLQNSVRFGVVFDQEYFTNQVRKLNNNLQVEFVQFDDNNETPAPQCLGMPSLQQQQSQQDVLLQVLQAFRPSDWLREVVESIQSNLQLQQDGDGDGMCLHYRNGEDWKSHCEHWGSIQDGVYRGNCEGNNDDSIVDALRDRQLPNNNNQKQKQQRRSIYLCGDETTAVRQELEQSDEYAVLTRDSLLSTTELQSRIRQEINKQHHRLEEDNLRDIYAWIDFCVCRSLNHFVGNSVSTFSALQIALRQNHDSYWYNSQNIPLADFAHNLFPVPIVYTYTELSQGTGKYMLMASIASVRRHLRHSPIHVLYHGDQDLNFQAWLRDAFDVTIHNHHVNPTWQASIEAMRRQGDASWSHLFQHAGNYFGTWQRIDIPLFVNHEYVLLMDSDTILYKPFSMADFGQDLTRTLAMSSEAEFDRRDDVPINAGVMLLNVPFLRRTYQRFVDFITSHAHSPQFQNDFPSDQGAYLEFYKGKIDFLSRCFNFKPYYQLSDIIMDETTTACGDGLPYIVHFHGPKPSDYLKHIVGMTQCPIATRHLCNKAVRLPWSLCLAFSAFAQSSSQLEQKRFVVGNDTTTGFVVNEYPYCQASFAEDDDEDNKQHKDGDTNALFCSDVMDALVERAAADDDDGCTSLASLILDTLLEVPYELPHQTKRDIVRRVYATRMLQPGSGGGGGGAKDGDKGGAGGGGAGGPGRGSKGSHSPSIVPSLIPGGSLVPSLVPSLTPAQPILPRVPTPALPPGAVPLPPTAGGWTLVPTPVVKENPASSSVPRRRRRRNNSCWVLSVAAAAVFLLL